MWTTPRYSREAPLLNRPSKKACLVRHLTHVTNPLSRSQRQQQHCLERHVFQVCPLHWLKRGALKPLQNNSQIPWWYQWSGHGEKPVRSLHKMANQQVLACCLLHKPHVTGGDSCQVNLNRGEGFLFVNQVLMTISLLLDTEKECVHFCDTIPQTLSTYSHTGT